MITLGNGKMDDVISGSKWLFTDVHGEIISYRTKMFEFEYGVRFENARIEQTANNKMSSKDLLPMRYVKYDCYIGSQCFL